MKIRCKAFIANSDGGKTTWVRNMLDNGDTDKMVPGNWVDVFDAFIEMLRPGDVISVHREGHRLEVFYWDRLAEPDRVEEFIKRHFPGNYATGVTTEDIVLDLLDRLRRWDN